MNKLLKLMLVSAIVVTSGVAAGGDNPRQGMPAVQAPNPAGQIGLNNQLLEAARGGDIEAVNSLLCQGANVNATDFIGYTALMMAMMNRHIDVVNSLIYHGADVNISTKWGFTALICAAEDGRSDIVTRLLRVPGIKVNAADRYKRTALMGAAKNGHGEIVNMLIENGANVNATDVSGLTALKLAERNGHTKIVLLLHQVKEQIAEPEVIVTTPSIEEYEVVQRTPLVM